jgi:hypothetical protein
LAPSRRCCAVRPSRPAFRPSVHPSSLAFPASSAAVAADLGSLHPQPSSRFPAAVGLHPPSSAAVAASFFGFLCRRRGGSGRPSFAILSRRRDFLPPSQFPSFSRAADLGYCVVRRPHLSRHPPAACCALPQPSSICCLLRPASAVVRLSTCWLLRPASAAVHLLPAAPCRTSAVVRLLHAARAAEPDLRRCLLCRPSPGARAADLVFCAVRRLRRSRSASSLFLRRWLPLRAVSSGQQSLSNSASAPRTSVNSYSGCCQLRFLWFVWFPVSCSP